MNSLYSAYYSLKPVVYTFILELKLQFKKFIIFSGMIFFLIFLVEYLGPLIGQPLDSIIDFYKHGIDYLLITLVLAVSIFFGGIICSEYKNKTGLTIVPLVNRYKLILGKYLANVVLVSGTTSVFYLTITLFAYNFYGGPLLNTVPYSFGLALLYALALSSIAIFLSSCLPSISTVILTMVGYFIVIDVIIFSFIFGTSGEIEPLYSFSYLFQIISYILYPNFSTMARRDEFTDQWLFPSIEGALILLSLYIILFFILGILLFKYRKF
ncbi:MAG: hypothetical protein ACFFDF_07495 [Candidatus Odinarchaeota archaeon]